MPRPSRPLDPSAGPVQAFAAELRELRQRAGEPKYLQMARKTGKSRTALAEAAGGDHLPTWETAAAFVKACGEEPNKWRVRWEQVRDARLLASQTVHVSAVKPSKGVAERPRFWRKQFLTYGVAVVVAALTASTVTALLIGSRHRSSTKAVAPQRVSLVVLLHR
jgi:hypothetical protein